jgi:hypothetical protein
MRIVFPVSHGAFSKAKGTRVVLPAPGGALKTALLPCVNVSRKTGSTSSIGSRFMLGFVTVGL